MIGHNWGAEHAERWIWLHGVFEQGAWLDKALGRVKVGPVLTPWRDRVPALLESWFPGQNGGSAMARVLFGDAAVVVPRTTYVAYGDDGSADVSVEALDE